MKRINHIIIFASILVLASCSQDDFQDNGLFADSERISFVASLPGVDTRTTYDIASKLFYDGFRVSAICSEDAPDSYGILPTHFKDAAVVREVDGIFRGDSCRWHENKGKKNDGHLKFFALHPSLAEMKTCAGVGNECFIYSNLTTKDADGVNYDYRLTKFRVAPDISRQVDFVTAIGEGNKTANIYSGIKINFEHQLSGVQIGVWGANTIYDIEIAGVRIGGTYVEADFSLSTEIAKPANDENKVGSWLIGDSSLHGHVDYVFTQGDKVVGINANEHNTKDRVSSIMGNGGNAMVIPYKHDKWDCVNDRENDNNGMYFSVLMRMREREGDRHIVFPSTDPQSRSYLVFLVVRKSDGMIIKRLSANEYDSYIAPDGQEKRAYGWAAVPVNVDWKPGYVYSYVLDYSKAVGLHDPIDSNPATPIIGYDGVEIGIINTSQWAGGEIIKNGGWGANSNNTAPDGTIWWK